MKALIIEDNEIETENLTILLEGFSMCNLVATAKTIEQGIELANSEQPDIIFLDIQLECENSLEHIPQLNYSPYIICCTLHTEHALQAFEVGVSDYLTKPITHTKLSRAFERLSNRSVMDLDNEKEKLISLNHGKKIIMIDVGEILQITADRDYTILRDEQNKEYLCSRRMREWAGLLPSKTFVSLDRSTIINKDKVRSFSQLSASRTAEIYYKNDHVLTIGATAFRRIKSIIC